MNTAIPKRPIIILFTQMLVFIFAALFLLFLTATLLAPPHLQETYRGAPWLVYASTSIHALLLVALATLSVGLVRRRRWAWWGSIIFAALLLALIVASRLRPAGQPIPILPIPPQQLFGAVIGDVVIFSALVAYPPRLFLSRSVRLFFGVA